MTALSRRLAAGPLIDLALELFDVGAVQFGEFVMKKDRGKTNPPTSPYLFNLRTAAEGRDGCLPEETVGRIGAVLAAYANTYDIRWDFVVGIPRAGEKFAEQFVCSQQEACPRERLLRLEKLVVDGDTRIGGFIGAKPAPWSRVLVIDDLITAATSKRETAASVTSVGASVEDVLVLIDRQEGGSEQLMSVGVSLHAIFDAMFLFNLYKATARIDARTYGRALAYLVNAPR